MNRRDFSKNSMLLGLGALSGGLSKNRNQEFLTSDYYQEASRKIPVRKFDVVIAGAGTAGVVAAIAAARQGVKVALIETKGYPGGTVVEGGTALHSFYNLWKAFPGTEKKQVVKGIPQEIIDELMLVNACSGHAEMTVGYDYDSVCTAIDTELYKLVVFEMLVKTGVQVFVHTLLVDSIVEGKSIKGVIVENRSGRQAFLGKSFIDCTAYGDLAAYAGAEYTEPNDYAVCNSLGIANVSMDRLHDFLKENDALTQLALGKRSGKNDQIVRLQGNATKLPGGYHEKAREIGMSTVTTTVHDNYFMFIKCNFKMDVSPTNADEFTKAELEVRRRMAKAVNIFREYVPGCEKAIMARTSPTLCIRRGRLIKCDYDITHEDVIDGRHFDDQVYVYGFHDSAPRYQIKDGGTYGVPYRALCVSGLENLYVSGMMITSDRRAHMSTRNTVSCMGMGQATGTAAALCAQKEVNSRELKYNDLHDQLVKDGVHFEWS